MSEVKHVSFHWSMECSSIVFVFSGVAKVNKFSFLWSMECDKKGSSIQSEEDNNYRFLLIGYVCMFEELVFSLQDHGDS